MKESKVNPAGVQALAEDLATLNGKIDNKIKYGQTTKTFNIDADANSAPTVLPPNDTNYNWRVLSAYADSLTLYVTGIDENGNVFIHNSNSSALTNRTVTVIWIGIHK